MNEDSAQTRRERRAELEARTAKKLRQGKEAVESAFWAWTHEKADHTTTEDALQHAINELENARAMLRELDRL